MGKMAVSSWPSAAELSDAKKKVAEMSGRDVRDVRVVISPYRICPLGAHIDHQGGTVLAMTVNKGIILAFVPSYDSQVVLCSGQFAGEVKFRVDEELPISMHVKEKNSGWGCYARGALYALQKAGNKLSKGIVGFISGSVGLDSSGLSSSAAIIMDMLASMTDLFRITFKFGGYWINVRNEDRRRYEGGKQTTISFEKDLLGFFMLKDKVEGICPWLKGHEFKMYYHINGTSPKEYMYIESDVEVIKMIDEHHLNGRVEIVITFQEDRENILSSQRKESLIAGNTLDCIYSNYSSTQCANVIVGASSSDFLMGEVTDDVKFEVGARFSNAQSFKQALRTTAIKNSFGVKIKASDRTRVIAICSQRDCPWRIRASLCGDGESFEVRNFISTHLCPGVNRAGNKLATSNWIAQEIQDVVKKQPNIPPKHIKNNLETTYGLSLPYMKLWRSREEARSLIFGEVDNNYRWVPTLKAELLRRNPGSHITYVCDGDNSFQRFYVSFKVCIDGFLAGCRHLVGLDACHLKSKYLGVLLAANSIDGNNGLFNIAFAGVESESKKTWQWFLENLLDSFGGDIYPLSFISDMEKGLGEAIKKVFPCAEHRVCVRHLWKNLKKLFRCPENQKVQSLVWSAANTYIKEEFDLKFGEIFDISPRIHSYLDSLPYKWARSTFSTEIKNSYNTNNMSESFNAWVGPSRDKPAVDLIDMIRGMIMVQRAERKIESSNWHGDFVPHIDEYIRAMTIRKEPFIIRPSSLYRAEVDGRHESHEVDLQNRDCTCRIWQMDGLPCIHAIALIASKEHPLWHTYIDQCYHVIRYKMAYEGAIGTLPGKNLWKIADDGFTVGIPKTVRPSGRPKKKRFKNFLEGNNSKIKQMHKCGRCGLSGHHRSTCKNPLNHVCATASEDDHNVFSSFNTSGLL